MLKDTGASIIIANSKSKEKLSSKNIKLVELDSDWALISKQPLSNTEINIASDQLAYVIYTSGSTGKPKGAMNEHRGVVNRLLWGQDYFRLNNDDAVLQKTTFCFDVSVWELFSPLIAGAKLVFAKPGGHTDTAYLKAVIADQKITLVHFVPSMLGVFLADLNPGDCKGLKNVSCSGEALSPSIANLFKEKLKGTVLHNLYGPTEAGIEVSYWTMPNTETSIERVPIGKPIANTSLYILNQQLQPLPIGLPGELHIGGVQVARGYLNLPELTKEKFISNPFDKESKTRLYKTGDLCRWLPMVTSNTLEEEMTR
jgi:amino acid adenylation domain-containing protein